MKRFILFMFDGFYPRGGMDDFVGSYGSLEKATPVRIKNLAGHLFGSGMEFAHADYEPSCDYYHIYDVDLDTRVRGGSPGKETNYSGDV